MTNNETEQKELAMNDQENSKKKVMTIKEVSEFLRIPLSTIYVLAQEGKIRGIKCGRRWRFLEEEILNYLRGISTDFGGKIISSLVLIFFLINTLVPPAFAESVRSLKLETTEKGTGHKLSLDFARDPELVEGRPVPFSVSEIRIPAEIGKIQEIYQAPSSKPQATKKCLKPAACSLQPAVKIGRAHV